MTSTERKTALVTGSSRGIGAAIAERLARDGFNLVVNYAGGAKPAAALVAPIEQGGGETISAPADVGDPAAAVRLWDAAEAAFGGVDVRVNNAGIMKLALLGSDDALFDSDIAVNLPDTYNALRRASKRLRDGGRMTNLPSSVVGLCAPTYAVYAATKSAIEAMTHVLAKELRGRGITVDTVAPGPTATSLFLDGKPQEVVPQCAKQALLERHGQPEDIAADVSFLGGPDGSWINGQVLRSNDGLI